MEDYKKLIINELDNYKVDKEEVKKWLNRYSLDIVAKNCSDKIDHPDWQYLGGYIMIMYIKDELKDMTYEERILYMKEHKFKNGQTLMNEKTANTILKYKNEIEKNILHENDKKYKYGAIKSLMHGYLLKCPKTNKILETVQESLIRISAQLYEEMYNKDINKFDLLKSYSALSNLKIVHATPTYCNAGTTTPQMSSCFLLSLGDSLDSIYKNLHRVAMISKNRGGLGIGISKIRHGKIGLNGYSKGIIPMIKVYDDTVSYVDQTGTRKGAGTITIAPHHYDIQEFIELKDNFGKEEFRARNLTYCVWIPDYFLIRALNNEKWTLFNPNDVKELDEVYGEEYEKLYLKYEKMEGIKKKTVSAKELYNKICEKQAKFSNPFLMFDDACNIKNNQTFLGHITNSNLCLEITQYNKPDELISSCNLGSVVLKSFVKYDDKNNKYYFDFDDLRYNTKLLVNNINRVIDNNFYPCDLIKPGNDNYRPIGIGIIGLADVFALLDIPYESEEAILLTEKISAAMYHAGLQQSCDLVEKYGKFKDFELSPIGKGNLQYHLWEIEKQKFLNYKNRGIVNEKFYQNIHRFDNGFSLIHPNDFNADESWEHLIQRIQSNGIVNSVLFCGLPSASTAGIVGCNESHEPFHSNLYCCEKISGNFYQHNDYLVNDLQKLDLWNRTFINYIIQNHGSINNISQFYKSYCYNNNLIIDSSILARLLYLELKYKTCFEIKQKHIIDLVSRRGHYICQSQSINLYLSNPNPKLLETIHIYSWLSGQKTGLYYLRQQNVHDKFVDHDNKTHSLNTNNNSSSNNSSTNNNSLNNTSNNNDNDNDIKNKLVCYKTDGCSFCE
jgi:ribonucleoside-diphosphate reductase alpha subunit